MLMWSLCIYMCQNLEGIFGTSKNRKVLTNFQRFCYRHVLLDALSRYHNNYLITISLLQSLQGWFLGLSNLLAVSYQQSLSFHRANFSISNSLPKFSLWFLPLSRYPLFTAFSFWSLDPSLISLSGLYLGTSS